jgi:DNA invertase Pin-like site-specific DNA recombinase
MKTHPEETEAAPLRVIGTIRCSTQEQGDSGLGLAAQESAIRAECEHRGWTLDRIAVDVGSAKTLKKRPELAKALEDLDAGHADVLMAMKLDRVSRSVIDFATLMARATERGFKLVLMDVDVDTTTPNGELVANIMSSIAQWERKIIGQRTKDALAEKQKQGIRLGRPTTLDPATRKRILASKAAGESLSAIARSLNEDGIPTGQGGSQWHPSTVRSIVMAAA